MKILSSRGAAAAAGLAALVAWPAIAAAQSPPSETPTSTTAAPPAADTAATAPAATGTTRPADRTATPAPRHRRRRHHDSSSARDFDLLWIGPELGLSIVNLKMISYDGLLPSEVDVKGSGLGFGLAAGVKLKILSAGLHLAVGQYAEFDVWTLNLDGQLRIPLGSVEPYLRLGLGYAFLGAFDGSVDSQVDVDGWDLKAGFGIDVYANDYLSLGGGVDFTILNLTSSVSPTAVDLTKDGAAVGLSIFLGGRAALHF